MTSRARKLRSDLTEAEKKLWRALRRDQLGGLNFRRQHPVGQYVIDFFCPSIWLAIELDGGQHGESIQQAKDERRTRWLCEKGIRVVRFWNSDVMSNFDGVLEEIARVASELTPSRRPAGADLPLSGGGVASGGVTP